MERSLVDLITNASLIKKLEQSGYESIIDIKEVGVVQITEELQLTTEEVEIILKLVHGGHIVASQTAEARIKADNQKIGISFSCKALDKLFDRYKGVPPSCITELCGEPGSGKTQICMQLAVNAPECIYIDTEGSLFPRRLRQMAETVMMNHNASSDNNNNKTDVDSILNKIHYFRVYDHVQLIALTRQLSNMLDELAQVKLLVLDSITYPLRTNINIKLRNNILSFLGQNLAQLASRHQVAVVVTNYVTEDRLNTAVTPELGDEWGRRCANRFFLYRTREQRYARYYKSSLGTKDTTIRFKITNNGLEDGSKDENHSIPLPGDENSSSFKEYKEEEEEDVWDSTHFTDQIISQIPSQNTSSMSQLKRKREDEDNDDQQAPTKNEDDEFDCWNSEEEEDMLFFAAYNSPPF